MKKFRILSLVALLCVLISAAAAQKTEKVDIFGYYFIEKAPKAFADISEIHLAGEYGKIQKPPLVGLIRLKNKKARDFKIKNLSLNGRVVRFTTFAVGGVFYKFSGNFTRLGDFPEERPDGEILLKGTLTKYKGKVKLAEAKLNFSYTAGD